LQALSLKQPLGSDDTFHIHQCILDFSTFWQRKVKDKSKIYKSDFVWERSTRITDKKRKKDDNLFFPDAQSVISYKRTPLKRILFSGLKVAHWSPGQTDSGVDASWKLGSTSDSVWPGLACTFVDLRRLGPTLIEIKFARKSTQVEWRPFVVIATY